MLTILMLTLISLVTSSEYLKLLGTYEGRTSVFSFGAVTSSVVHVENADFRLHFYSQNDTFVRGSLFRRVNSVQNATYVYQSDVYGILAEDIGLQRWNVQLRQFIREGFVGGNYTKGTLFGYLNSKENMFIQFVGESDSADVFSGFTVDFSRTR
jgi:hypothetical protein